ncbi:phosphoribosylanthranilate isomerase [Fulvivirgaceae bacterium PWU4]|uniref:N-(5'-phosphoribosyl)anthranilate isomerase n=2 Tax=Chryseosolibacter histidini TaxID=2782349 RepID=A0AAP2DL79_9BACT|nr:phosphoribosylanthranilate isomerase [Chryseosolibacter histidini]
MKLKICGMRDEKNILAVAALHPQYMGFIFYPRSPRYVGDDFKVPALPSSISRVGVFVNDPVSLIMEKVDRYALKYVQLHGGETVAQCKALRQEGVGVIKVFSVDDDFDFNQTRPYEEVADFFLFDTKGKYYGGNATAFDWKVLEQYNQKVPFFLSGGIGPDNVEAIQALKGMNIHAIDINSGVEESPAMKDTQKIGTIIHVLNSIS